MPSPSLKRARPTTSPPNLARLRELLLTKDETHVEAELVSKGIDRATARTLATRAIDEGAPLRRSLRSFVSNLDGSDEGIATGIPDLDALFKLNGGKGEGLRSGHVVELVGSPSTLPSQVAYKFLASCVRSGRRSVFVDTCGTFNPRNLVRLLEGEAEVRLESALSLAHVVRAYTAADLIAALDAIVSETETLQPVSLLIVDSLFPLLAPITTGVRHGSLSHAVSVQVARAFRQVATRRGAAVVVTNATVRGSEQTQQQPPSLRPALGQTWALIPTVRVELTPGFHARVTSSGPLHGREVAFQL